MPLLYSVIATDNQCFRIFYGSKSIGFGQFSLRCFCQETITGGQPYIEQLSCGYKYRIYLFHVFFRFNELNNAQNTIVAPRI